MYWVRFSKYERHATSAAADVCRRMQLPLSSQHPARVYEIWWTFTYFSFVLLWSGEWNKDGGLRLLPHCTSDRVRWWPARDCRAEACDVQGKILMILHDDLSWHLLLWNFHNTRSSIYILYNTRYFHKHWLWGLIVRVGTQCKNFLNVNLVATSYPTHWEIPYFE